MHNDTLATILGQALADSDDVTLPGIEAVVGELALHIRSVSGDDLASKFLARVRRDSLRILEAGPPDAKPIGTARRIGQRSDLLAALNAVSDTMTGSTSPSL